MKLNISKVSTFHYDLGEHQDKKPQKATNSHCELQQATTNLCDSFHLVQSLFRELVQEAQEELLLQEESLPSSHSGVHKDTNSPSLKSQKKYIYSIIFVQDSNFTLFTNKHKLINLAYPKFNCLKKNINFIKIYPFNLTSYINKHL